MVQKDTVQRRASSRFTTGTNKILSYTMGDIDEDLKQEENKWKPQPWQLEPYSDRRSKIILLTGSAGGGKSAVLCAKAHRVCSAYPGAYVLGVRKTRESMNSSMALFLEEEIIKSAAIHNKSKSEFVYPNGSRLKYLGMNNIKQSENVRGIGRTAGVDFIICDEATQLTEKDFGELLGRLRAKTMGWRQIMLATNPDAPGHWIYQRLILGGEATVIASSASMNKFVDDEYRETLKTLPTILRKRLAEGLWVSAEGLVFDSFNAHNNVIPRFKIPKDWRRIGSIDFGYENPSVVQWWAIDEDNRMYMYREIYKTKVIAADLARMIKKYSQYETGHKIQIQWVADHQADQRATLRRHNILTKRSSKKVMDGINLVNDRLKVQGDGHPGVFLFDDALVETDNALKEKYLPTSTAEEFTGYVWKKKPDGGVTDEPDKKNDHGMDALRYAIVEVHKPKMKLYSTNY